ncbi:MAG: hypothetical protein RBQ67_04875 [Candidatus Cloacimonadaceae bacterium]|nr:hypothetical protein [Candidatus Cloacimonadaceae bacterium]
MRCKKCNNRLADHDIWCVACGTQTQVLKTSLAATASLRKTREHLRNRIGEMVPATGFSIILGVIPIAVLTWVFHNYVNTEGTVQLFTVLAIKAVLYSLFLAFLLLPFSVIGNDQEYGLKLKQLWMNRRSYPRYLVFSLINSIYFIIIYLVCFGVPGFASDPILRLVWVVLVNYWMAIALPAPVIMEKMNLTPFRAILLSYRHLHDARWNIYLLVLILGVMNLVAFSLAIFPLLFTLPLSYFALRDYVYLLDSFELFEYRM